MSELLLVPSGPPTKEPRHPLKEDSIGCFCPQLNSFGHYPDVMTTATGKGLDSLHFCSMTFPRTVPRIRTLCYVSDAGNKYWSDQSQTIGYENHTTVCSMAAFLLFNQAYPPAQHWINLAMAPWFFRASWRLQQNMKATREFSVVWVSIEVNGRSSNHSYTRNVMWSCLKAVDQQVNLESTSSEPQQSSIMLALLLISCSILPLGEPNTLVLLHVK